jgi:hypothetical protein
MVRFYQDRSIEKRAVVTESFEGSIVVVHHHVAHGDNVVNQDSLFARLGDIEVSKNFDARYSGHGPQTKRAIRLYYGIKLDALVLHVRLDPLSFRFTGFLLEEYLWFLH